MPPRPMYFRSIEEGGKLAARHKAAGKSAPLSPTDRGEAFKNGPPRSSGWVHEGDDKVYQLERFQGPQQLGYRRGKDGTMKPRMRLRWSADGHGNYPKVGAGNSNRITKRDQAIPPKKRNPLQQKALDRLDHLRITPQQSRAAGALSSVGTTSGSLLGAAVGTGIGIAVKKPAQGAGLGAGIGGALGGGTGAAAGLYSGRPKKKQLGVTETKVKKNQNRTPDGRFATGGAMAGAALAVAGVGNAGHRAYQHGQTLKQHGKTVAENEAKIQVARAGQEISRHLGRKPMDPKTQVYNRAIVGARNAIDASARGVAHSKARTVRGAALAGALTVAGAGVAAHTSHRVAKAFDESQVRRNRGQFAPKTGMTAVPGASKPVLSDDHKVKAAQAGLFGAQLADVAAAKTAWNETRRARLAGPGVRNAVRYGASKAAFPVVVGGLGATLLANHVMTNQAKKLKEQSVQKNANPATAARRSQQTIDRSKKETRTVAATGAGLLAAGEAGGLAVSRAARKHVAHAELAQRVANSGPNSPWLKGPARQEAARRAMSSAYKARSLGESATVARGAGRIYGGLALAAGAIGAKRAHDAQQKHNQSFGKSHTQEPLMSAPDVHELFAKARGEVVEKFEPETKRAAKTGAKWGAGLGAVEGGIGGAYVGSKMGGKLGAVTGGLTRGASMATTGAASYGAVGAGVGAIKAKRRIKREAVGKSAPSVEELFAEARGEVAKFERETIKGAKTGAKINGALGAIAGGAAMGAATKNPIGAVAGAIQGGAGGAAQGALIGGGIGAIKAKKRINRVAGIAQP